ncbi:MAG: ankyrin repeat domain-containing protein [Candidatus Pacebacteria bacterium]|nr:ankyrin repeat domain-containing protein [Candidatus Paceibacterota bacterium]
MTKINRNYSQIAFFKAARQLILVAGFGFLTLSHLSAQTSTDSVDSANSGQVTTSQSDNPAGAPKLLEAAFNGNSDLVKSLLAAGADVNARNAEGRTALMDAAYKGNVKMVKLLLAAGASVNLQSKDGSTAMMSAVANGNKEVIDLLLKANAKLDIKNDNGWTALMWASYKNNSDVGKTLIRAGSEVNTVATAGENIGKTPLLMAAKNGNSQLVTQLVEAKADVNQADADGETALMFAAKSGNRDALQSLIAADANVDATDNDGTTALMFAVKSGNRDAVQSLIAANANVDATDNDGTTALMFAAKSGNRDAVQSLIAASANLDLADNDGMTALMFAVSAGNRDAAQELIDAGADTKKISTGGEFEGKNAADIAAIKNLKELRDKLVAVIREEEQQEEEAKRKNNSELSKSDSAVKENDSSTSQASNKDSVYSNNNWNKSSSDKKYEGSFSILTGTGLVYNNIGYKNKVADASIALDLISTTSKESGTGIGIELLYLPKTEGKKSYQPVGSTSSYDFNFNMSLTAVNLLFKPQASSEYVDVYTKFFFGFGYMSLADVRPTGFTRSSFIGSSSDLAKEFDDYTGIAFDYGLGLGTNIRLVGGWGLSAEALWIGYAGGNGTDSLKKKTFTDSINGAYYGVFYGLSYSY